MKRFALLLLVQGAFAPDPLPAALEVLLNEPDPPPPPSKVSVDWNAQWQPAASDDGAAAAAQQDAANQQQPLGTWEPDRPPVEDTFARERAQGPPWPTPPQAQPTAAASRIRSQAAAVASQSVDLPKACRAARTNDLAVVTLITSNEGYPAGALAISASLEVLDSALRRVALVTETVSSGIRELLRSAAWEVREVPAIQCHQKMGDKMTSDKYDLGAEYQAKRAKWLGTCTKFHAWRLTEFQKVVFLDADTLVLRSIDTLVDHPSAFAAAPDTFPADQFNSGVMVIQPSQTRYSELLEWNRVNGTAEGGDQCLLNDFFGEWYYNAWDDPEAGRLPWVFNVGAAHHEAYRTLTRMQSRDEPVVVHFVGGESKPWIFMVLKFQQMEDRIPPSVRRLTHAWDQLYWLAKTNRVCTGTLTDEEKWRARTLLEEV